MTGCDREAQKGKKSREQQPAKELIIIETRRTMHNAPIYTAIEKGFFQDQKISVRLENCSDSSQAIAALDSGEGRCLAATCDTVLYLYQQGQKDLALIGQISNSRGYYLLSRNKSPFKWQDLKGKVVLGYHGGDLPYTLFYAALRNNGLGPFLSIHPVENLPYPAIPAVYQAGSGSFLLAEEPLVSYCESEGLGQVISDLQLTAAPLPAHGLVLKKDYLHNNQKECRDILKAIELGMAWLDRESPSAIAELLQPYFPEYQEIVLQRAAGRYKNVGCWEGLSVDGQAFFELQEILLSEKELLRLIPPGEVLVDIPQA